MFARPQRTADAYFTVLACSHGNAPARLGLAISKKQVRHAVQRNRLKRLAREAFRQQRAQLHGYDLVVMARPAAAKADNARLRASLTAHLERLAAVAEVNER